MSGATPLEIFWTAITSFGWLSVALLLWIVVRATRTLHRRGITGMERTIAHDSVWLMVLFLWWMTALTAIGVMALLDLRIPLVTILILFSLVLSVLAYVAKRFHDLWDISDLIDSDD
jgi:hypothetical protein